MGMKRPPQIATRRSQRGVMLMILILIFAVPIIFGAYLGLVVKPGLDLVQNRMSQHQADYAALSLAWECSKISACRQIGQGSAQPSDWPAQYAGNGQESIFEQIALSLLQMVTLSSNAHAQGSDCEPPDCFSGTASAAGDGKTKVRVVDSTNSNVDLKAAAEAIAEPAGGGVACIHASKTSGANVFDLGQTQGPKGAVSLIAVDCGIVVSSDHNNALRVLQNSLISACDSENYPNGCEDQDEPSHQIRVAGKSANIQGVAAPEPTYDDDTISGACDETDPFDGVDLSDSSICCPVSGTLSIKGEMIANNGEEININEEDHRCAWRNNNGAIEFDKGLCISNGNLEIDDGANVVFRDGFYYIDGNFFVGLDTKNKSESPALGVINTTEEDPAVFYIDGDLHIEGSAIDMEFFGELVANTIEIRDQAKITVKHAGTHDYSCTGGTSQKPYIVD